LTSTVLSGDPTNPLGGLTFTYLITNDATSSDSIDRLTINSYTGVGVDAGFDPPPGVAPTLINRSVTGDTVGFSFFGPPFGPGELLPGSGSTLLVVRTDSPLFAPTFASVINGTVTSVASFAPTAVPEPSSLTLLALGIVAGALRLRRR
jgi:hypothetical protein